MTSPDAAPMRAFTSPSGREWTASLAVAPALRTVLRFTSSDLVLDLVEWPSDWETIADDALVSLVREAQPPRLGLPRVSPASGTSEGR